MAADLTHDQRHGIGGKGKPAGKIKAADRADHTDRADLQKVLMLGASVPKAQCRRAHKTHILGQKRFRGGSGRCYVTGLRRRDQRIMTTLAAISLHALTSFFASSSYLTFFSDVFGQHHQRTNAFAGAH